MYKSNKYFFKPKGIFTLTVFLNYKKEQSNRSNQIFMLICYVNNVFNKMTITKGNYTKQRETYIQGSNTNEDKYKDGEAQALMIFNERLVVHKLWRLNGGFRNSSHPFGGSSSSYLSPS